jgi:malate synthase
MQVKIDYNKAIVALEEFLAEYKDSTHLVGVIEYDYIFSSYETLMRLTEKPANVYLDVDDLKLLGDYL